VLFSTSSSVILSSFLALGVPHFAKEREREREREKGAKESKRRESFFLGAIMTSRSFLFSFSCQLVVVVVVVVVVVCLVSRAAGRKATRGGGGEDG